MSSAGADDGRRNGHQGNSVKPQSTLAIDGCGKGGLDEREAVRLGEVALDLALVHEAQAGVLPVIRRYSL